MSEFYLNDTLSRIIENDLKDTRIVPFLAGEPAIGKTAFAYGLGQRTGTKVFSISVNTLADKGDLTGARTLQDPTDNKWKQMFFPHETFVEANDYAARHPDETVIVLLDEINRADSDVTSAAMTISTERRVGTTMLQDNIRLIVTGNLTGNVTHLDSASLTRFSLYEVKPSTTVFISIMGDDLNPHIRTVLNRYPEYIFVKPSSATSLITVDDDDDTATNAKAMLDFGSQFGSDQDMVQFTAPRTIEGLSIWLNNCGDAFLHELLTTESDTNDARSANLLQHALRSHTGDTPFTAELLSEISKSLLSAPVQGPTGPIKPAAYDVLLTTRDATELQHEVSGITDDHILADVLMYALHDQINTKAENIIKAVANNNALAVFPSQKIAQLIGYGVVPARNYAAFNRVDNPIAQKLNGPIMDILKGE